MSQILPADTQMGAVTLRARDLDALVNFYTRGVGLEVLASLSGSYLLGHNGQTLLIIEHAPELRHAGAHEAGLFHTAFLFETQAELATAVASVATKFPGLFTGSADHLVSEAFYFDDPEGNGVELYFDKDRSTWSWQHGQIQMGTFSFDPNQYLSTHARPESSFSPSRVGHVHLSVGNIEQAHSFYVEQLGFETTLNWGGTALFVSAGGYHHHMAMNIWKSRGAGRRQLALGLGEVRIQLQSEEVVASAKDRLIFSGGVVHDTETGFITEDPWGNAVSLSLA
jgi:catechol 2,3-dioxygenase